MRREKATETPSLSSATVGQAVSRSGGVVFCYCGLRCELQRARTSKNFGRSFYGCPLYCHNRSRGFFKWVDSVEDRRYLDRKETYNVDATVVVLQRQVEALERDVVMSRQEMMAHISAHHNNGMLKWMVICSVIATSFICWMIAAMGKGF